MFRQSQMTVLFALAGFPHVTHFLPAYRIQIVGFAHMQISVFEFQHFGCGEGAAFSFEPRSFFEKLNVCAVAQRVWRTMFKPSSQEFHIIKMGVLLPFSTILHMRDHFHAQDQMFRRRAARVALCFGVSIHGVMASPSVMLKVAFLLRVTLEKWLIARRELRRCVIVQQSVGAVRWLPSLGFRPHTHISKGQRHHHHDVPRPEQDR